MATLSRAPVFVADRREIAPGSYLNADTSRGSPRALLKEVVVPSGTVKTPFFAPVHPSTDNWLPADTSHSVPKTLNPPDPRQRYLPLQLPPQAVAGLTPNPDTSHSTPKTLNPPDPRQRYLPLQLPPQATPYLPADTSQQVPSPLRTESVIPIGVVAPFFTQVQHPAREYLNSDTTQDSPQTVRPEPRLPFQAEPPLVPLTVFYLPLSTTQGASAVLFPLPAPVVNLAITLPVDRLYMPIDTTQDTPQTLRPESALPIGENAPFFEQVQHPKPEAINADTTQGTPKGLRPEAATPVGTVAPFFEQEQRPDAEFLSPDTTKGTPKGLLPEVTLPFQEEPGLAPQATAFQPADTTQSLPDVLRPVVLPPVTLLFSAPARWEVLADTSRGTSKALLPEIVLPFQEQPALLLQATPYQPSDTTQGISDVLRSVPTPFATAPQLAPARWEVLSDTTKGMPKPLLAETTLPFQAEPPLPALRYWFQPADTSSGVPKALLPETSLPFQAEPASAPQTKQYLLSDTTQGMADALRSVPTPFSTLLASAPARWETLADTTKGTPKALLPETSLPFQAEPPLPVQQKVFLSPDTSVGTASPLRPIVQPPPATLFFLSAQSNPEYLLLDTSKGTPKTLVAETVLPFQAEPGVLPQATAYLPVDTTKGISAVLRPAPNPPITTVLFGAQSAPQYLLDTSRGTPKTLLAETKLPFQAEPPLAVQQKLYQPLDTSVSLSAFPVAVPFGTAYVFAQPAFNFVDTTRSTPKTLLAETTPLQVAPPVFAMREWLQPLDSTQGTPKVLLPEVPKPFKAEGLFVPQTKPYLPEDTTLEMSAVLRPLIPPPPFTTINFAPVQASFQPLDSTRGTPQTMLPPGPPPAPPIVVTPDIGGGRYPRPYTIVYPYFEEKKEEEKRVPVPQPVTIVCSTRTEQVIIASTYAVTHEDVLRVRVITKSKVGAAATAELNVTFGVTYSGETLHKSQTVGKVHDTELDEFLELVEMINDVHALRMAA